MNPRDGDMLTIEEEADALEEEWVARWRVNVAHPQMIVVPPRSAAAHANGYRPRTSDRLLGLLLAALSAAFVAGLLGFTVGRVTAAPRTAPSDSGPWTLLEAPQADAGSVRSASSGSSQAPSTNRNGPALSEPSSDPNTSGDTISGTATWYCGGGSPCTVGYGPSDLIAAIDPTIGIAKGERVTVTYRGRSVVVRIVDVCACPGGRIIDLSRLAFSRLADPSLGVIPVSLETGGPSVTVPPTDR